MTKQKKKILSSKVDVLNAINNNTLSIPLKNHDDNISDENYDIDCSDAKSLFNLTNHFLIAMPGFSTPFFDGAVVYLCEHNSNGAFGIIINKPTEMTINILLDNDSNLKLKLVPNTKEFILEKTTKTIMFGGPIQIDRGFVLHNITNEKSPIFNSTLNIASDISLTTSRDILESFSRGDGPSQLLISLGCSGWGAGQLEEEIMNNHWLIVDANSEVIFDVPCEQRFFAAVKLLGVNPLMLSNQYGYV
ncbi:YqgE/AlgH family protein [Candidatus Profftella armatura]